VSVFLQRNSRRGFLLSTARVRSSRSLKKFSRNSFAVPRLKFHRARGYDCRIQCRSAANGGLAATIARNRNFSRVDWIAGIGTQVDARYIDYRSGYRLPAPALKVASLSEPPPLRARPILKALRETISLCWYLRVPRMRHVS